MHGAGFVTITVSIGDSNTGSTWTATSPGQRTVTRFISGPLNGAANTATMSDCLVDDTGSRCFPNCRQTFTGTLTSAGLTGNYAKLPGDSCVNAHSRSVNTSR